MARVDSVRPTFAVLPLTIILEGSLKNRYIAKTVPRHKKKTRKP